MKISIRKGFGFGLTSGIITTLGLMIGLNAGTHLKGVVIAGILTIAIADAFSDALGVHISEESGFKGVRKKEVWESTISTFLSKLFFALTFIVPVLLFSLQTAIVISVIWGLSLITIFSYYIGKRRGSGFKMVFEHLVIAVAVIVITYFVGGWVGGLF